MPRNKHPEETVQKILDTSLRLFAEKGYEQTTVLDIVANLGGLTRGAFYHHFKSKEEVLRAIIDSEYYRRNAFDEAKKRAFPNGLARLRFALDLALKANIEDEQSELVTRLALSLLENPRFLVEHIRGINEDAKNMAILIEEGMADGSIKPGNALALAELFLLFSNVWMMPGIFPANKQHAKEKGDIIVQIFKGLGYDFIDTNLYDSFFGMLHKLED